MPGSFRLTHDGEGSLVFTQTGLSFTGRQCFRVRVRRLRRSGVNVRPLTGEDFLGRFSRLFCLALAKHY